MTVISFPKPLCGVGVGRGRGYILTDLVITDSHIEYRTVSIKSITDQLQVSQIKDNNNEFIKEML